MFCTPFVLIVVVFCSFGNAANVAVINTYLAPSHFAFLVKLTDILADEGHNMTMIVTELDKTKFAPLPKKARVIIRSEFSSSPTLHGKADQSFWNSGFEGLHTRKMYTQYTTAIEDQCERLMADKAFIESMKAEKFDIALLEPSDFCGYGFLKLIKVSNFVNAYPMALTEKFAYALGLPARNFEPFPSSYDYHPELSYFERLSNFIFPMVLHYVNTFDGNGISASIIRKYVDPEFSMINEVGNARLTFVNSEEHMDFPRPISHKVVYIGGITVANGSADDLPEDYKQIFDSAKKGVVLFSFGSVAKGTSTPQRIKDAFLEMFAAFPEINFIWKYENASDPIADKLPNVFKRTWVPQTMILAHPKLLAFITHGGMNSIMESGHAGVPLLGIPLFGDQDRNLKMLEYRKTAVILLKSKLTAANLITAIHKLTDTDFYKSHARTLAALIKSKPLSGKQRFIAYFNQAAAFVHADDYLDIGHRKMDTFKYYNFDIYGTFVLVTVLVSVVLVKIGSKVGYVVSTAFKKPLETKKHK